MKKIKLLISVLVFAAAGTALVFGCPCGCDKAIPSDEDIWYEGSRRLVMDEDHKDMPAPTDETGEEDLVHKKYKLVMDDDFDDQHVIMDA